MRTPSSSSVNAKIIKNYQILSLIGKGGMGEVYLAKHPTLNKKIVLKKLKTRNREDIKRFLQEAKVMLEFRHENIVQVFDHFEEKSQAYIAMEYIQGKSLSDIIKEREKIPVEIALYIIYQTALGLYHAHSKKVIHRDIKPHNIMISVNGDVKITDFGIARKQSESNDDAITSTDTIIGTPAYMPPEQFSKSKDITHSADIYSLGVVLYEMLTGQRPFKNECSAEVIDAISRKKCDNLNKYLKNPPAIVKKIINKTFNPKIKSRYPTLYPLIKLLRKYFKKFNILEVKDTLKKIVLNDKNFNKSILFQNINKRNKAAQLRTLIFSALITISGIGLFIWKTDAVYKYILRDHYGKVTLEFGKANLNPANIFYGIDNDLRKAVFKGNDIFKTECYLPAGEHTFTVISGSYKNKKTITVYPQSVTVNNIVKIPVFNLLQKEVIAYFRFWDQLDNTRLLYRYDVAPDQNQMANINCYLYIQNDTSENYMRIDEYSQNKIIDNKEILLSNNSYKLAVKGFTFNGTRYFDRFFDVNFALDDRTVVYHDTLTPVPGKIVISYTDRKPQIIINDENSGLVYINDHYNRINYSSIAPVNSGNTNEIILELPPGVYSVKASNTAKQINIRSDSVYRINL